MLIIYSNISYGIAGVNIGNCIIAVFRSAMLTRLCRGNYYVDNSGVDVCSQPYVYNIAIVVPLAIIVSCISVCIHPIFIFVLLRKNFLLNFIYFNNIVLLLFGNCSI